MAELPAADLAELINQLRLQEAASVMSMLAPARAVEVLDQPTLRRRSEIVEKLEPGRASQLLEALSSDQRTEIVRGMGEVCPPAAAPQALRRGARGGGEPAAVSRSAPRAAS